jgi:hypothetical protein
MRALNTGLTWLGASFERFAVSPECGLALLGCCAVDYENPVEVVDFVLEQAGVQAVCLDANRCTIEGERFARDLARAIDRDLDARQ